MLQLKWIQKPKEKIHDEHVPVDTPDRQQHHHGPLNQHRGQLLSACPVLYCSTVVYCHRQPVVNTKLRCFSVSPLRFLPECVKSAQCRLLNYNPVYSSQCVSALWANYRTQKWHWLLLTFCLSPAADPYLSAPVRISHYIFIYLSINASRGFNYVCNRQSIVLETSVSGVISQHICTGATYLASAADASSHQLTYPMLQVWL